VLFRDSMLSRKRLAFHLMRITEKNLDRFRLRPEGNNSLRRMALAAERMQRGCNCLFNGEGFQAREG
jgi:hypothetical protein